jgi:GTPase
MSDYVDPTEASDFPDPDGPGPPAMNGPAPSETASGFVGLAGRPNVGKSTLVNSIVGATVAIATVRPQTTRRAIRGVATDEESGKQLVMVDLPGVQRPRDKLTSRMQKTVEHSLSDADVVLFVLNGEEGIGAGDRFIASTLLGTGLKVPIVCAVNKADRLGRNIIPVLAEAGAMSGISDVFPISALTGEGVPELKAHLGSLMPNGPYLYPPGDTTDQPVGQLVAELIRSQALVRTRDEIPHSLEVKVIDMKTREDGLIAIAAEIWVEAPSQRGILIGKDGFRIQEIGTDSRKLLEQELDAKVFLDLQVKLKRKWRRDEDMLDRLGID